MAWACLFCGSELTRGELLGCNNNAPANCWMLYHSAADVSLGRPLCCSDAVLFPPPAGWAPPFAALVKTPAVPALPAKPRRFNVGDVVRATAATLAKQPQWRGRSWTVQKYLPDANCGNCGGACPSIVLGLVTAWECAVELVGQQQAPAVPKSIPVAQAALRPATARARYPKLACCGWCGDPLVQLYVPGRPGVRGCDVHGSECPVLEPEILQARRP